MQKKRKLKIFSPKLNTSNYFIVIWGFLTQMVLSECPTLCDCKWKNGKESAICLYANLINVPSNLDFSTQILDLTGNNILIIKELEFSKAGLVNLQKLYLVKCRLRMIEINALKNLINLVELDLSYNVITQIPSYIFDNIPELRDLKLNGNPITKIQNNAFLNIPHLNRLEISDCKLVTIEPNAFFGLEKTLEYLKLNKNKMTSLNSDAVIGFQNLHGLELADNPWNCSCELQPLRNWLLERNVPFGEPPACNSPKRLYKKTWEKLNLDEFACMPEIFAYESTSHALEGTNVTLSCYITDTAQTNIRWMLKNKAIGNISDVHTSNVKRLYVIQLNNSSSLTIFSADLQDAGTYVCIAENKAGKSEASVMLTISRKPVNNYFKAYQFLLIVIFFIVGSVVICLLVIIIYFIAKKKSTLKKYYRNRESNYEKIEMTQNAYLNVRKNKQDPPTIAKKNYEYFTVPDTDQEHEDVDKTFQSLNSSHDDLEGSKETVQHRGDRSFGVSSNIYKHLQSTSGISSTMSLATSSKVPIFDLNSYNQDLRSNIYTKADTYFEPNFPGNLRNSTKFSNSLVNASNDNITDLNKNKSYTINSTFINENGHMSLPRSECNDFDGDMYSRIKKSYDNFSNGSSECLSNLNKKKSNTFSRSNSYSLRDDALSLENCTPLLDISGLEKKIMYKRGNNLNINFNSNIVKPNNHVSQLEKFLEEYRHLEVQLAKLKKETSLELDKHDIHSLSSIKSLSSDFISNQNYTNKNLIPTTSNQSLENSVDFKKFEKDLTNYLLSTNHCDELAFDFR